MLRQYKQLFIMFHLCTCNIFVILYVLWAGVTRLDEQNGKGAMLQNVHCFLWPAYTS